MTNAPSFLTHEQVMGELCRRSYPEYVEYVQRGRYIHGAFTRYITNYVQEFINKNTGNAYDVLCLSVPPQHSKSTSITETLPSWIIGQHPDWRIILTAYGDDLAKLFLRRNREKVEDFGSIFGINIGTPNTANEFVIDGHVGSIIARGIGAGISGRPAEVIIIDDPIKNREEADSPTIRNKIWGEWMSTLKSRLAPNGKVIIIQTRWHKEDLIGMMLQNEENVEYINFPVECLEDSDVLGRKKGDTLFPEIGKDIAWWNSFKISYMNKEGSQALTSLYYGTPTNVEGGLFKRKWFIDNMYRELPRLAYKVIEVDATFKDTKKSDYVAIQVWGKVGKDCYLIEKINRRMGFVDTLEAIKEVAKRHPDYMELGIEDKANGSAIVDVLKRSYRAVIPIEPYGSKEARASAISPMVEAGDVHIKEEHYSLLEQAVDFPNSDHDDEVDCMSQALNRLRSVVAVLPTVKDPYDESIDYDDQINNILTFR